MRTLVCCEDSNHLPFLNLKMCFSKFLRRSTSRTRLDRSQIKVLAPETMSQTTLNESAGIGSPLVMIPPLTYSSPIVSPESGGQNKKFPHAPNLDDPSPSKGPVELCAQPSPMPRPSSDLRRRIQQQPRQRHYLPILSKVDHQIAILGGTTAALERQPERLEASKGDQETPYKAIERLQREIGHLRREIKYLEGYERAYTRLRKHADHACSRLDEGGEMIEDGLTELQGCRERVQSGIDHIRTCLDQCDYMTKGSEQSFNEYWAANGTR